MSLQFARVGYDTHELVADEQSNQKIFDYMHQRSAQEVQNSCYIPFGNGPSPSMMKRPMADGFIDFENKADIESKLRNIHIPLNSVNKTNDDYKNVATNDATNCGIDTMVNENSRFHHPIQNYREMSTTHLAFTPYLHMNPQNVVAEVNDFNAPKERMGATSRMQTRVYLNDYRKNRKETEAELSKDWEKRHASLLPQFKKGITERKFFDKNQ